MSFSFDADAYRRVLDKRLQEFMAREERYQRGEKPEIYVDKIVHGLRIRVIQGPMGVNGYVAVPKEHPDWGKHYDFSYEEWKANDEEEMISVHGGLTWSTQGVEGDHCFPNPDLWWFGFDTSHADDWERNNGEGWTIKEVEEETERLAEQFALRRAAFKTLQTAKGKDSETPLYTEQELRNGNEVPKR